MSNHALTSNATRDQLANAFVPVSNTFHAHGASLMLNLSRKKSTKGRGHKKISSVKSLNYFVGIFFIAHFFIEISIAAFLFLLDVLTITQHKHATQIINRFSSLSLVISFHHTHMFAVSQTIQAEEYV